MPAPEKKPKDVNFGDNQNKEKPREPAVGPTDDSDRGIKPSDADVSHA